MPGSEAPSSPAMSLADTIASFKPLSKTALEAKLERLEATVADAVTRWTDPDDFANVDLVVSRLLHEGSVDAALMYLKKARLPTTCGKAFCTRGPYSPDMATWSVEVLAHERQKVHGSGKCFTVTRAIVIAVANLLCEV
jgi:hypothetical protein